MDTQDFRSLPSAAQEDLRRKAVNAVLSGTGRCAAAKLFGVTRQAIRTWMVLYAAGGEKALLATLRGAPKREGILKPWQCALAVRTITDKCPEPLKLPGFWLWTRDAVRDYPCSSFGVELSLSSGGRLLRRWGLTPQKPARRAYQRDAAACTRWMEEEYPAIRARAKKGKARVMWGDECGFRSDHQTGTSYGRKGQPPVIPSPGTRFGSNMVSAIDNAGHLAFKMFEGKFNGTVFIDFMRRLIRQTGRKVFRIVDNLKAHKGEAVMRWVKKHSASIRLFFLPKYSPDLNPDE